MRPSLRQVAFSDSSAKFDGGPPRAQTKLDQGLDERGASRRSPAHHHLLWNAMRSLVDGPSRDEGRGRLLPGAKDRERPRPQRPVG